MFRSTGTYVPVSERKSSLRSPERFAYREKTKQMTSSKTYKSPRFKGTTVYRPMYDELSRLERFIVLSSVVPNVDRRAAKAALEKAQRVWMARVIDLWDFVNAQPTKPRWAEKFFFQNSIVCPPCSCWTTRSDCRPCSRKICPFCFARKFVRPVWEKYQQWQAAASRSLLPWYHLVAVTSRTRYSWAAFKQWSVEMHVLNHCLLDARVPGLIGRVSHCFFEPYADYVYLRRRMLFLGLRDLGLPPLEGVSHGTEFEVRQFDLENNFKAFGHVLWHPTSWIHSPVDAMSAMLDGTFRFRGFASSGVFRTGKQKDAIPDFTEIT